MVLKGIATFFKGYYIMKLALNNMFLDRLNKISQILVIQNLKIISRYGETFLY